MTDGTNSLTDRIRNWFERTPKAQKAYQRLAADLDTVVARVDTATTDLRERITPIIDPPREPAPLHRADAPPPESAAAAPAPDGEKPPS